MQKYDMLIKGAKKEYTDRNQAKYSIRSRKNTVSNNQRLLLTATKSATKEEKVKVVGTEGTQPVKDGQKQPKIHMN